VITENLKGIKNQIRELGLLNTLLEQYPDLFFWRSYDPVIRQNLLRGLSGREREIEQAYSLYFLDLSSKTIIGKDKIGEDQPTKN